MPLNATHLVLLIPISCHEGKFSLCKFREDFYSRGFNFAILVLLGSLRNHDGDTEENVD